MGRRIKQLEEARGKPIDAILREEYERHGQQKAVAKSLKIAPSTVRYWLMNSGLEEKTVLVEKESGK